MCTNLMHTLTIVSRWNVKWSVKYKVYLCPVAFKYTFNVQWHELINALSVERWVRLWLLDVYRFSVNSGDNNNDDAIRIIIIIFDTEIFYRSNKNCFSLNAEISTSNNNHIHTDLKLFTCVHFVFLFSVQCSFAVHLTIRLYYYFRFHQMCM